MCPSSCTASFTTRSSYSFRSTSPPGEVVAQGILMRLASARYVARIFARIFGAFPPKTARFLAIGFLGLCGLVFVLYFVPYDLLLYPGKILSWAGEHTTPWGFTRFEISVEGPAVQRMLTWMLLGVGAWLAAVFLPIVIFARDDLTPVVPNPETTSSRKKAAR